MKIATISTSLYGGAGIAAYRLHKALRSNYGIESNFVHKFNRWILKDEDYEYSIYSGGLSFIDRVKGRLKVDEENLFKKEIKDILPKVKIEAVNPPYSSFRLEKNEIIKEADILHLHWVAQFINYPTFFKNVKQPIVWTLHDMNPFMGLFHYEEDYLRTKSSLGKLEEKIIREKRKIIHKKNNIHIVCLSEWMMEKSKKSDIFGCYPHYLIPNGLKLSDYPIMDKSHAKRELGLDNELKTIFFIADDINNIRKGFDLFSEAIGMLDQNIKFNLISIGGEKKNIGDNFNHIHYEKTDNITKLNTMYSAADITVIASREDNLPNVMLESFANGTPILSFRNGGMAEHIRTGENGILADEVSPQALKKSIEGFLSDQYTFDNIAIRNYMEQNLAQKIQVKKYINLYNSILNKQ